MTRLFCRETLKLVALESGKRLERRKAVENLERRLERGRDLTYGRHR
jgi:hypothetical protein